MRNIAYGLLFILPLTAADYRDARNADDSHTKTHFHGRVYYSLAEWEKRREDIQRQILISAGLWPIPQKTPLSPRRFGRREYNSYAIEKVLIEPFPVFFLAGNLYTPLEKPTPAPAVLVAHGHWKNGRIHHAEDYSVPALCINLASQGYVAFAYDMLGYNDTQQLKHTFGDTTEEKLWSFGPLGIQLWNSIRALDFLAGLPEVNPQRLAMTGASGGAMQTFLASAVDERIRAAALVDMVSANFQGDDACEMAPGLRIGTNNVEIAALMAPRPLLLVSSTQDWTRNTPLEEFPEILKIYNLYHRDENIANRHVDAPHNYNSASRSAVYEFFNRVLMPSGRRFATAPVETEDFTGDPGQFLLGDTGSRLPQYRDLFASWKTMTRQLNTSSGGRDLLRAVLHASWPERVETTSRGDFLFLNREGSRDSVPARYIPGADSGDVVVVHSRGSAAALTWNQAKELHKHGFNLLLLDVYQIGDAAEHRSVVRRDYLVFHPSDDSQRVQDILTGLASLRVPPQKTATLLCDKSARLWCWTAAAAAERPVRIVGPAADLENAERDLPAQLFVPGIQRIGGIDLIRQLASKWGTTETSRHSSGTSRGR